MTKLHLKSVEHYLNNALSNISPNSLRDEIAKELRCHLQESIEEGRSLGLSEEQATASAITKMGPPHELGRRLADIHRPVINWWIVGPTLILLFVGWLGMYSAGRLGGQLLFSLVGLFLGGLLAFLDFSKLKRYAFPLFVMTVSAVVSAFFLGPKYDGQPYLFVGPLRIKLMDACPFLFVIALAGMISQKTWQTPRPTFLFLFGTVLAQALFLVTNSLPSLSFFVIGTIAVMHSSCAKYWQVCLVGLVGTASGILLFDSRSFVQSDLFQATQFADSHTDFVLNFLLGTFGKWLGVLTLSAALLLWIQLIDIVNTIKAETPRLIVVGVAALLGSEFAWGTLANLGWAPMPTAGLNFPLVSFGGTLLVVHLASLGLTVGAYRRRTLGTL